ncbi:MAG: GIY-YIG nuclease family protein [Ignavibacteriales bacterium]|nr:GIY-YIG nuclease family protein [Ignavibacteriales bacterium]MCB9210478.1 GIY-YIG nuclease family protein [Ignavibacteriales bacterium]MCB9219711.1 GIY-YIG nuclease family protein [Ignavibacteriales bacterium]
MFYTLYILKSLVADRFYVGHTNNLLRRIDEHNSGQTKSTKPYKPWEVVFTIEITSKSEAYNIERFIKSKKSKIFIKKLIKGEIKL